MGSAGEEVELLIRLQWTRRFTNRLVCMQSGSFFYPIRIVGLLVFSTPITPRVLFSIPSPFSYKSFGLDSSSVFLFVPYSAGGRGFSGLGWE